jgi:hypothetical protein
MPSPDPKTDPKKTLERIKALREGALARVDQTRSREQALEGIVDLLIELGEAKGMPFAPRKRDDVDHLRAYLTEVFGQLDAALLMSYRLEQGLADITRILDKKKPG